VADIRIADSLDQNGAAVADLFGSLNRFGLGETGQTGGMRRGFPFAVAVCGSPIRQTPRRNGIALSSERVAKNSLALIRASVPVTPVPSYSHSPIESVA
jgi:hypothetical protein